MRSSIKVSGFEDLMRNMGIAEEHMEEVVQDTIERAAFKTRDFAIKGIQRSPSTGRVYEKYNPRRTHQASAPGERPASDTGRLASSIEIEGLGKKVVAVGTAVMYGRHLEFGTRNMFSRPWLQPSFELALKDVIKDAKKNFHKRFK